MKLKPQTAYVLRELRRHPDGLSYNYFRQGGERYIADPAKRVSELRALGYSIEVRPERSPSGSVTRRVFLRGEPAEVSAAPGSDPGRSPRRRADLGGSPPPAPVPDIASAGAGSPSGLFDGDEFKSRPKHDEEMAA